MGELDSSFAEWPSVLFRECFTHFHAIEGANFALRVHRERRGASGGFAEGHGGDGHSRRGMCTPGGTVASACDEQVFNLLRK